MKNAYFLYRGEEKIPFTIPRQWQVIKHTDVNVGSPSTPIGELTEKALAAPIGSPGLREIANEETTVAILVDDPARVTPVHAMLPPILSELREAGVPPENITIVVALGTHRPASEKDLEKKLGRPALDGYRVVQHDCHGEHLVPICRLSTGTEVAIDPFVAKAHIKIGVGSIFPHPMNGFGGGAKILFPGVSNFEAIKEHHFHYTPEPGCLPGNIDTNPFYHEVCRVAEEAGLNFIVNCLFDARERVKEVVAGHFKQAHLRGIEKSKKEYAFSMEEPADVTILSASPYEEGPQVIKPIIPASLIATKPGGSVIVFAGCPNGMPEPMLQAFDAVFATKPEHTGKFAVNAFKTSTLMAEGAIDFNCALFFALVCAARTRVTIVSEDLDEPTVQRLGFHYAPSLEIAIRNEQERRAQATVNIFPLGGLLLPIAPSLNNLYEF